MQKGKSRRPPIIPTPEYVEKFVEERGKVRKGSNQKARLTKDIIDEGFAYMGSVLDTLVSVYDRMEIPETLENAPKCLQRYTPKQMYDNSLIYLRATIKAKQPLTITGLGLFMGIERRDFFELLRERKAVKESPFMRFLYDFATFIEMYNEYAAHVKHNPAGPIFILKNFGWTDRLELAMPNAPGALSEEERELAKKRILESNEPYFEQPEGRP